jgi:photosystem II stability/assembly factor-like uncharacterized protein
MPWADHYRSILENGGKQGMTDCTTIRGVKWLRTGRRAYSICMVLAGLGTLLAGCEAALDLSGVNSQASKSTQRSDLLQAAAVHEENAIVVGGMGVVVRSGDGGASWQRTVLPGNPFLVDVSACPDGSFHAIDKTDGFWSLQSGSAWVRQALPEMTEPQAMACDEENVLWVTGGFSTILHSADTGASWEAWSLDEDLYLTTIQFVDRLHGVATGEFGTILLSEDGGASWTRANDLPEGFYPQDAFFTDTETGWVVGLNGTIWQTNDGGASWEQAPSGISTPLYGIAGNGKALVAVGDNTTIIHRKMEDAAWSPLDDAARSLTYLRGVAYLGDGHFVVAGGGGTVITIPGPGADDPAGRSQPDE